MRFATNTGNNTAVTIVNAGIILCFIDSIVEKVSGKLLESI